jgi:hypothetical protein
MKFNLKKGKNMMAGVGLTDTFFLISCFSMTPPLFSNPTTKMQRK